MPGKDWDEESESDTAPAPALKVLPRRGKFDDEEEEDDLIDSWDAEEDSEVEREKAKVAAEKKAKADAEAAANKKSKAQRVAERIAAKKLLAEQGSDSESEEDEAAKRERLRREEKRGDMEHAADLFGESLGGDDMFEGVGIPNTRTKKTAANAVVVDAADPAATVDLTKLPLFDPHTAKQFTLLKETLTPLLAANSSKAQYALFLPDFVKAICQELSSDDIKKVASKLTAFGNERMKEEKEKAKGGKKTKAQKGKVALAGARSAASGKDTTVYDQDDFGDDDFM